jgi:hypothetical protein
MIWKRWRARAIYLLMSGFLAWHTLAMMIAPAPSSSVAIKTLRTALQPYLTLVGLDHPWDFFAPAVGHFPILRYVVEDADGVHHTLSPMEDLNWFHPGFYWFRTWYYAIIDDPEIYADYAGAVFCRKHASFRPVSITFWAYQEGDFKPADQLGGKHPFDPEFLKEKKVKTVQCPSS